MQTSFVVVSYNRQSTSALTETKKKNHMVIKTPTTKNNCFISVAWSWITAEAANSSTINRFIFQSAQMSGERSMQAWQILKHGGLLHQPLHRGRFVKL